MAVGKRLTADSMLVSPKRWRAGGVVSGQRQGGWYDGSDVITSKWHHQHSCYRRTNHGIDRPTAMSNMLQYPD